MLCWWAASAKVVVAEAVGLAVVAVAFVVTRIASAVIARVCVFGVRSGGDFGCTSIPFISSPVLCPFT